MWGMIPPQAIVAGKKDHNYNSEYLNQGFQLCISSDASGRWPAEDGQE
jgi:hypothetical protein